MVFSIIIFIATLLTLVLIHELGHFLFAKKFGIKVEEFGFGIPPKVWGKKFGETLVSINWLPLGGFVRLLGEDEVNKNILANPRSFAHKKVWERIMVVFAGVLMNFILAWIIFYISLGFAGFKFQLPLLVDHKFLGVEQTNENFVVITNVSKDSPAEAANLKTGEQIISINGESVNASGDFIAKTKSQAGKEIKLTVLDSDKQTREVQITPRENPPVGQGPLGIALTSVALANMEYKSPLQKVFAGPLHSINLAIYSGKVIGKLIGQSFAKRTLEPISSSVSGPVGIGILANDILTKASNPALAYLDFMGLLSLNLAVINLLPIPAMDGGRLFFLLVEAITRKRVHAEIEKWVHTIGMVFLLCLAVLITFSDVRKLF